MLKSILRGNGVISENEEFILYEPKNSQDMNYHLINKETRQEHLIDIGDVYDKPCDDYEYYGGITYTELIALNDMENIMIQVWKTIEKGEN